MARNGPDYFGGLSDSDSENQADLRPAIDNFGLAMSDDEDRNNENLVDTMEPEEASLSDSPESSLNDGLKKEDGVQKEIDSTDNSIVVPNKSETPTETFPCSGPSTSWETNFKRRTERLEETPKRRRTEEHEPIVPVQWDMMKTPIKLNAEEPDEPNENKLEPKATVSAPPILSTQFPISSSISSPRKSIPPPKSEVVLNSIVPSSEVEMKRMVILANMTREQVDRYEAYRRSSFTKSWVSNEIKKHTGATPSANVILTFRTLAKVLVGDIVEEALDLRNKLNQEDAPLQPEHIKSAFMDLVRKKKIWPPYGHK